MQHNLIQRSPTEQHSNGVSSEGVNRGARGVVSAVDLFHGRLQWWEHVIIHVPLNVLTPRVNPHVKYGLGVIMMGQGRWVSWDRQICLVGDSGSEEGCAYVGTGICGNCVLSTHFFY